MTTSTTPAFEVRNLGKDYVQAQPFSRAQSTVRAFEGIDLTVQRGKTLAIVGESGAGKSSLARCLALLESPSRGEIFFDGQIRSQSLKARAIRPAPEDTVDISKSDGFSQSSIQRSGNRGRAAKGSANRHDKSNRATVPSS